MNKALGTAVWTSPDEVAERHPFADGAFWLGRSPTEDAEPIGYNDDRHICLVSGNRGGKGTTSIVPNLALWPGSIVVVDPKGENATVTARRRGPGSSGCKGMGQAVYVLDPFNAAVIPRDLRSRFNPLDALDPSREETVDEAGRVADALIVMNPESKDPFWDESARAMVKGIILHVLTAEEFEGQRNLLTIRDLITRGDIKKVEILQGMGETEIPSAHALLWEGASRNQAFNGTVSRIGSSIANMLAHSAKQYESVRQVADRNTEFIDSPGMQRCLAGSDFKLSDLKTKPEGVSLFLSLPQRYMNTHFRWLRMMIALTLTEMEATPGQPANGHRVLFCLDEFAGLKRMEVIENAVAQIAGYGVKLMFVLQTLEQLKGTYKDKWETFLSNCGLKIFFGLEDFFSRKYVSEFLGETEVIREAQTKGQSVGTQKGQTHTTSKQSGVAVNEQSSVSVNDTVTDSKQSNTTFTKGTHRGKSGGSNWSLQIGRNSNSGSSWKPGIFFGDNDERRSSGGGGSLGGSYGRQGGWNDGDNKSTAHGQGIGYAEARSTGRNFASGITFNEGRGESDAVSVNESQTENRGVNESVHKRRLIAEDEIGTFFKRITDKSHPAYPGFALVLVSGENPLFVRKVNYYEDPQFIKCFDPHPDHPYLPLEEHMDWLPPPPLLLESDLPSERIELSVTSWEAASSRVKAGDELAKFTLRDLDDDSISYSGALRIPVTGSIVEVAPWRWPHFGKYGQSETVAVFRYYGEKQKPLNPYEEIDGLLSSLRSARQAKEELRLKTEKEAEEQRFEKIRHLEWEGAELWKRTSLWIAGTGWLVSLTVFYLVIPPIVMSIWLRKLLMDIARNRDELEKLYRP